MSQKLLCRLLFLGLCCFASLAGAESRKELLPSPPSELPLPVRCFASVEFGYVQGTVMQLNNVDFDKFTRRGGSIGSGCLFTFWRRKVPWLHFGIETRFYTGDIVAQHHTAYVDATALGNEYGAVFRGKVLATTKYFDIGITGGVEVTPEGRLAINDLQVVFGTAILDFTKFATDHITATGSLKVLDAGINTRFKIWRKSSFTGLSLTLDIMWQMYLITTRATVDPVGQRLLEALKYDTSRLSITDSSSHTYFIVPGIEYCHKSVCVYTTVPLGVYNKENWGAGVRFGVRLLFQP
ncbi:MAG: hypothetical protein A2754_02765 [Candidatus Magasanikbacteria bacterium RIFCSPHIGHO2_01_FULL_47_8]|uniref:Outer membrane protein beta-barrel domain-containing protein n=1 Tax=Candidatus Magasanikbacteria bacterium RIFCSPHIGHO2_01_FULL_47_8 TaxID=1798673 RepID=A0A1F6MBW6_9BACT|nr:MAG: hypothetical protein A2754_02765 [Candidatus Magasanikbacteria bacterium RIFCSPHIGHO2_01_FULL_47_8]